MRVLIIAEVDLRRQGSGAERVLAGHVTGLLRRGHSVSVVCGGRGAPTHDGRLRVLRVGWSVLTPSRARAATERLLAEEAVDAVMIHHAYPAWQLVRSPRLGRAVVTSVFHSPWDDEYLVRHPHRRGPVHAFWRLVRRRIEGSVIRRTARVYPLSRFMAARVVAIHGVRADAIRVIPGGVDRERFVPSSDRAALRHWLGFPPSAPVLLTLRNLEPRMGLEALMRAMPAVLARHPGSVLVVGGTGPLLRELQSLAAALGVAGSVRFPGFIPEDELPATYAAADLFVLPTQALEGFGLVTLEALACGTAVLGSRVGATPELLEPLDPELLLPDLSPESIAAGIIRFLARPDRVELAARCRAHTAQYAWSRVVGALEHELNELVGAREGGGAA